jgi:azurin
VHLQVESDGDFLTFKPDHLSVPAGTVVTVTFHHSGHIISQKHDWVLADKGEMPALLSQSNQLAAGSEGEDKSFIKPGDKRVIAATPQVSKGETTTIRFIAPAAGDYPFFCSTPAMPTPCVECCASSQIRQ